MPLRPSGLALCFCLLCASFPFSAEPVERLRPESDKPWPVETPAPFRKEGTVLSFSGFACAPKAPDLCLLALDEGREGVFMRLGKERLDYVGKPFGYPGVNKEFDAEGVAADDDYFYVVGSHAVKRTTCEDNPEARRVYRIEKHDAGQITSIEYADRLWCLMQDIPELKPYVAPRACLGQRPPRKRPDLAGKNGVNIEGVAAANGRLFFGLRGPSVDGTGFVVSVDARALFSGGDAKPAIARITVGKKRGFRDLAAAEGEILGLVGPNDDSLRVPYSIVELRGLSRGERPVARELAILNLDGAPVGREGGPIKPEALAVLDADSKHYRVLVLSDGGESGAPLVFDVPR